jgi:hypothetical protein
MRGKTEMHDFYCINCGRKAYTLPRRIGHQHEKFHKKKLYCWSCKQEWNCVEVRNYEEAQEFKEAWEAGKYKEEVKD